MAGSEGGAVVKAEVAMIDVVERRDQERRGQQNPREHPSGGLSGERTQVLPASRSAAPHEPADGHQRVDVRDLGEPRIERQRDRYRDQPPAPSAALGRGGVGELDPQQQQREERDRVDRRMREPRERPVQRERDPAGGRCPPIDGDPAEQEIRGDPRDDLEQHALVQLPVGDQS